MSTAERDLHREDLRERIVEASLDIVGEQGLDALSMRALAVRIGYSPATIYLHFRDKDELLRSVREEGFRRLDETMGAALRGDGAGGGPGGGPALERLMSAGRAYARFALEHTGYFRTMFEMPGVAQLKSCPEASTDAALRGSALGLLRAAEASGELASGGAERAAVLGWGLMHGLTSLYLSGHLADQVRSHEEFMELVDSAIETLREVWRAD